MPKDRDQDRNEAGGRRQGGSGKAPTALVILYLIILVWAVLSWFRPGGP